MQEPCLQSDEYYCPGQKHPIPRAVHLGRLATFYPTCRECPHRGETGTLSPRQVKRLQEVEMHRRPRSLFHDEGAGGVYLNDFTPTAARDIAAAFAAVIGDGERGARDEGQRCLPSPFGRGVGSEGENGCNQDQSQEALTLTLSQRERGPFSKTLSQRERGPASNPQSLIPNPSLLLAGDGRPITAELTAAVAEGIRASGCDVVDIGPATAACLAFAVHRLQAAGGVLVGNPSRQPHVVGMQFWSIGAKPLSIGGSLEPIIERYQAGIDRRAGDYGKLHRFQADPLYLAAMGVQYHAMRPLRVVVDSASRPLVQYFQRLAESVACQVIPSRVASHELPEQIRAESAHFAVCIDGDGETCHVFDQRGEAVSSERLLLLLAKHGSSKNIILEEDVSRSVLERLERHGLHPVLSGAGRAEMASVMREHGAMLGGGPSGRFWHSVAGIPLPDALATVTRLLLILSQSDEPLSTVLDRDALLG